jgi:hypothetical protein
MARSAVASRRQGVVGDLEGGHREGVRQGGGGRGAPERCANGEAAQTASGGGVQRRWGSFGGRRRAWRSPAAQGRPEGEEAAVNLGMEQLGGGVHRRGQTALPRDSGERRGRRDAGGVADRWARTRRGARSSVAQCGEGQRGEAVGAALTGGVGSTVRPIRFSN